MAKQMDAIRIKQARGQLLVNLNLFYPSPVKLSTLYRTVCGDPLYGRALFEKDIAYFLDKRYIIAVDDVLGGMPEFMDKVVKLTASGKEIAEGTATDPALEI